ncbi:MAG: hypothetical protein V3V35_09310 [Dehalococcoidia bacterium]
MTVGADGNLTASTRTIPAGTAYGTNTVTVTDSGSRRGVGSFTATQPAIAISPASGTVGTSVTVTGSGWLANSLVTISRSGTAAITVTADGSGGLTAQLPIPSTLFTTGGTVLVAIAANDGATGNVADSQTFTISPAVLTLSTASVPVGGSVTVSGTGFLPFTGLGTLSIGGVSVLPTSPVISNSVGDWSATFLTPGLVGVQTLTVTHGTVNRTATVTITQAVGGTNQPIATETALQPLIAAGVLELAAGVAGGGSVFLAFVPGLAGNPLTLIQPNSVLILTLTQTTTVVVSGVTFTVQANTPSFIPVGANVTITIQ